MTRGAWLGLALACAAATAHAEPALQADAATSSAPAADSAAEERAREANLESTAPRHGTTFSAMLGGATFLGLGTQNSVGRGPAVSFRLGHVATPRTVLTFELTAMSMLHAVGGQTYPNTHGNLLAGAQYYTSSSLWVRGAGGFGIYDRRGDPMHTQPIAGPAGAFGIGIDLVRRHYLVLDLEVTLVGMVNREGVLTNGALGLGLNYY